MGRLWRREGGGGVDGCEGTGNLLILNSGYTNL